MANKEGQFRVSMPGHENNEEGGDATPWSKFVEFTQKVVSVPKEEIDEQTKKYEEEKADR